MYCVILPTTKMSFIFVSIQRATNTLNFLANPIYEILFESFHCNFFSLANKYLLAPNLIPETFQVLTLILISVLTIADTLC